MKRMKVKKDQVFSSKMDKVPKFQFNRKVAEAFDDMVSRSVPFYTEIHSILLDLIDRQYPHSTPIYDLGCSTGTTIKLMEQHFRKTKTPRGKMFGIDNSEAMIEFCKKKCQRIKNVELLCQNIEQTKFEKSGLVIMNYTLQFIPTKNRLKILKEIHRQLVPGGLFILSEKIRCSNTTLHNLTTDLYYDFKRRRGYSELEISQKREALEKVLIPLTPEKQIEQLKAAGFKKVDVLFRWYNFACYVGIK